MKQTICSVLGVIGSVIASFFGGWDAGLATLLIFMGLDYISDGYATSSTYVQNNMNLVEQYELTKYDSEKSDNMSDRQKPGNWLAQYEGIAEGSEQHKAILKVFNDSGLCGTVLTAVWNGVPALYRGVPSSVAIWKVGLYRNIPFVRMV